MMKVSPRKKAELIADSGVSFWCTLKTVQATKVETANISAMNLTVVRTLSRAGSDIAPPIAPVMSSRKGT